MNDLPTEMLYEVIPGVFENNGFYPEYTVKLNGEFQSKVRLTIRFENRKIAIEFANEAAKEEGEIIKHSMNRNIERLRVIFHDKVEI